MNNSASRRAGITLMEVLIAVGILAVGLSSVVSLLPAGHALAQRSFIADQAAIVAANAAADFVTQGYLRPASLSGANPPVLNVPAIFDPLYDPAGSNWLTGGSPIRLRREGALAIPAPPSPPAPPPPFRTSQPINSYLVRSRDDLVYNVDDNDDKDVTNRFNPAGFRDFQGKFTWAALLARADGLAGPLSPGDVGLLTIIVFHQREPGTPALPSPPPPPPAPSYPFYTTGTLTWRDPLVGDRKDKDVLRTGSIMLLTPRSPYTGATCLRRVTLAAIEASATPSDSEPNKAFVDFEGGDPPAVPPLSPPPGPPEFEAYLLPDAVAILQREVTIESANGYSP